MRSPTTDQGPVAASEPEKAAEPLQRLFELFNVRALGDGDTAAGANTLAAMAVTIANISAPETGLVHNGDVLSVGTSLLVSGSLTASLLTKVLAPVQRLQTHLVQNVADSLRAAAKAGPGQSLDQTVRAALGDHTAFGPIHQPYGYTPVRGLLGESDTRQRDELHQRPRVVATCTTPVQVAAYLDLAHQGRAFAYVPVASPTHAAKLGHAVAAIIHGTSSSDPPRHVQGFVLATLGQDQLAKSVRANCDDTGWIDLLVWLTDIPCAPTVEVHTKPAVMLDRIEARYQEAVTQAAAARLEFQQHVEANIKFDCHQAQAAFVRFLAKQEAACPGITGTARTLFVTLLYGLFEILTARGFNTRAQLIPGDVAAFARHLVRRMVFARQCLLEGEKREQLMTLASRLAYKLEDTGGADVRTLTRKTYRLSTGTCRESLMLLKAAGFATERDSVWVMLKPAGEFLKTFNQPVIDI